MSTVTWLFVGLDYHPGFRAGQCAGLPKANNFSITAAAMIGAQIAGLPGWRRWAWSSARRLKPAGGAADLAEELVAPRRLAHGRYWPHPQYVGAGSKQSPDKERLFRRTIAGGFDARGDTCSRV